MKTLNKVLFITLTITSMNSFANSGASNNASTASKHSALALSHGLVATAQLGSAVIATPLLIVGSIGHISMEAGKSLMENATGKQPLTITDKTIVTAPSPKQIMNKKEVL
jgi:hypothetical protein